MILRSSCSCPTFFFHYFMWIYVIIMVCIFTGASRVGLAVTKFARRVFSSKPPVYDISTRFNSFLDLSSGMAAWEWADYVMPLDKTGDSVVLIR